MSVLSMKKPANSAHNWVIGVFSGDILMLWVAVRHALCVPSVLPHRVLEKHVLKGRLSKINSFNGFIKDIL